MVILYFSNNFNKEEKMKRKIPVAIIGKNFDISFSKVFRKD